MLKGTWILLIIFLIPLVHAETTFFDNPDDFFIMVNPPTSDTQPGMGGRYSEIIESKPEITVRKEKIDKKNILFFFLFFIFIYCIILRRKKH